MADTDVVKRANDLIAALKILQKEAGGSASSLGNLSKIINNLAHDKIDVTSMREASMMLASFRNNLKNLGAESTQIDRLTKKFIALADAVQKSSLKTSYGRVSRSTTRVNKLLKDEDEAIGLGNLASLIKENIIYEKELKNIESIKGYLTRTETYWREALEKADAIAKLKRETIRKLNWTETGGLFNLPPGNFPSIYPIQSTILPAGRLPMEQNLLPPGNPPTQFPLIRVGDQWPIPPKLLPPPPTITPPPPIIPPPPAEIPSALMVIPKSINDYTKRYAESVAESIGKRESPEEGKKEDVTRKTIKDIREQIPLWKGEQIIDADSLKTIGLSNTAAQNLSKTLQDLGLKQARVTTSSTEVSTGISTIGFEAAGAGGSVRTFTAHIDRYGNVLQDTQKRFRGFGSAVMRDIVEVLKWTIAISAIYTPIRKIGEMMEEMKKIQLDLVDVQIVLGNSSRDLNTVLEASAQIASETSSSWEGVIEGYSLAAAASSSAETEMQRMITTETLLKDSMILSKLANIDQKQALDTLVGSLSQLGMTLDQGTTLLDSWVAVSKKANVSVKDMATSFTIVGSAAEEVGLTYNELNALIGGLAQSTNLSADELGNAIRGIISTMQTDRAQQEFAKYGIATKTFSNDLRDLMAVLNEMKVLSQTGVLDEKAMGALTQAGGGGARRGAQLSALVQNLGRVMELVTISEQASGDAAQAMELEMATLDAATTRLNNSFSMLAVTLGGEGGVLKALTFITEGLTFLITKLKDLTSVLKGAAPLLAGFLLAKGISKTPQGAGLLNRPITDWMTSLFISPSTSMLGEDKKILQGTRLPGILNRIFGKYQAKNIGMPEAVSTAPGTPVGIPGGGIMYYTGPGTGVGAQGNIGYEKATWNQFGKSIATSLSKQFLGNLSAANLMGPALIAAGNITQGGSWGRAGAGAAGGILLAAVTGSPLWATVGATIATGFYDKFLTFQGDLAVSWTKYAKEASKLPPDMSDDSVAIMDKLNTDIKNSLNPWQLFITNLEAYGNTLLGKWGVGNVTTQIATQALTGQPGTGKEPVGQAEMILAYGLLEGGTLTGELLTNEQKEKIRDLVRRWTTEMIEKGTITGEVPLTPTQEQVQKEMSAVAQYAATASATMLKEAIDAIAAGAEGAIPAYVEVQDATTKLSNTAASLIAAQKGLSTDVNEFLGTNIPQMKGVVAAPGYQPFTPEEAVTYLQGLTPEETQSTATAYTEVKDLLDAIFNLNAAIEDQAGGATTEQVRTMEEYKIKLLAIGKSFPEVLGALEKSSFVNMFKDKIREFIELPLMTDEQIAQVKAEAEKQWADWFKAQEATPEQIEAYKNSLTAMKLKIGEDFTGIETIIPQNFWAGALETLGLGQPASITEMRDVTTTQLQSMMMMYPQLIKQLEQVFKEAEMTWQPSEQDYLVVTKDGFETVHADLSILGLLQQDLLDETKKQGLQGIYNLPAGATFMVPVSAYELDRATRSEMAESGSATASILQSIFDLLSNTLPGLTKDEELTPQQESSRAQTELNLRAMERINRAEARDNVIKTGGIPLTPQTPATLTAPLGGMGGANLGSLQTTLDTLMLPFLDSYKTLLEQSPAARVQREYEITPQEPPAESELNLLERLLQWLSNTQLLPQFNIAPEANLQGNAPLTTALNLDVTSNIQLMVDGRTLATIIKPYLYQDLIRYMTSANSSVNRSVIG